jgi:nitroreductase
MRTPSGGKRQPWAYIVMHEPGTRQAIADYESSSSCNWVTCTSWRTCQEKAGESSGKPDA